MAGASKTKLENEGSYKLILDVLGDIDIQSITRNISRNLRETLMQLPANLYKIYPGKSVKGVLSMADITPMSISSMNKHVSRFSTLMKFCRDEYGLSENPALGLTFRQKRRHDEERKAYSGEDIKKMIEVIQSHTKRPVGRQWDNVVELLISIRKNPSKSGS